MLLLASDVDRMSSHMLHAPAINAVSPFQDRDGGFVTSQYRQQTKIQPIIQKV
jgi:hypothetical protein